MRELLPHPETSQPYPQRYKFLAVHAYEQGKITQVQLARFLRCDGDVVMARQIVTECLTSPDVAADGRLEVLHLGEFQKSLLSSAS